jgi:hypothetical protein
MALHEFVCEEARAPPYFQIFAIKYFQMWKKIVTRKTRNQAPGNPVFPQLHFLEVGYHRDRNKLLGHQLGARSKRAVVKSDHRTACTEFNNLLTPIRRTKFTKSKNSL